MHMLATCVKLTPAGDGTILRPFGLFRRRLGFRMILPDSPDASQGAATSMAPTDHRYVAAAPRTGKPPRLSRAADARVRAGLDAGGGGG